MRRLPALCLALFLASAPARAGLYYSGEEIAPLPSQWRGFLVDVRLLRNVGVKPTERFPAGPLRLRYEKAAAELESAAKTRKLGADEQADLGALHLRLGNLPRALEVLRAAQRQSPKHFRVVSNLGTAWQTSGDLRQAALCLRDAVRLAPGALQRAEELQLKLVELRLREGRDAAGLDDLFGVRFVNDRGKYEPGKLGAAEKKKLPADAVAVLQQLTLWLPTDGRLLWQAGELAAVYGDLRTAAGVMDSCVGEFALRSPELRRRRAAVRQAAEAQAKLPPGSKTDHEGHAGVLKTRSVRPLVDRRAHTELPPVKPDGVNGLPWAVVSETTLDRQYRPTFPKYLRELDGRRVTLTGYVQPLGNDPDMTAFLLIEYPVGCWYCEVPELTSMLLVELPPGKLQTFTREPVQVTGQLRLNAADPEDFLYAVREATVQGAR